MNARCRHNRTCILRTSVWKVSKRVSAKNADKVRGSHGVTHATFSRERCLHFCRCDTAPRPGFDVACSHHMATLTRRSYARVGLLGNPSDGYHGRTISVLIENYFAEVGTARQAYRSHWASCQ